MRNRMQAAATTKQTHKLTPQTCVIWIPDAPGYAVNFGNGQLQVANHPSQARHLSEDAAEELALRLSAELGLRAAIRPYYAPLAISGAIAIAPALLGGV